jgi:hypothetical protein
MPTVSYRRFLTEKSFVMPGDDVRCSDGDHHHTARAHVVLDRAGGGDVLNHPLVSALHLGAATTRGTRYVEGRHLVAFRTVAATH